MKPLLEMLKATYDLMSPDEIRAMFDPKYETE